MTNKNNLDSDGRFILLSYLKGITHATLVPYALLWIFQGLGLWAFAVSAIYLFIVGTGYYNSKRHDLSRAAFFGTVIVIVLIASFFITLAAIK